LERKEGLAQSNLRRSAQFRASFDRLIFATSMRLGLWEISRKYLRRVESRHDLMWVYRRRERFLFIVRAWAMVRWRPAVSTPPTLLLASEENSASVEAWRLICPQLRVTRVHGNHGQIFEPTTLQVVRDAFLQHLADACDQATA
jgi:hypothetical protein